MSKPRRFFYGVGWKPGTVGYEVDRLAEWAGLYPKEKRRFYESPATERIVSPQQSNPWAAWAVAEAECKALRAAVRDLRKHKRTFKGVQDAESFWGNYELLKFQLRMAEWAREFLMRKVDREALIKRFEAREKKHGYPMTKEWARRLLVFKIAAMAF